MRHIILLGIVLFFGYLAWLANYVGFFKPVLLNEEERGPLVVLYKNHLGPYHKILPVIQEVENWATDNRVSCPDTFGEYLDDPEQVEQERLRSHGGCVIESAPDSLPIGYEIREIPKQKFLVATFQGSPGIGPFKVYPKAKEFAKNRKLRLIGPIIEIYHIDDLESKTAMTTTYLFQTTTAD